MQVLQLVLLSAWKNICLQYLAGHHQERDKVNDCQGSKTISTCRSVKLPKPSETFHPGLSKMLSPPSTLSSTLSRCTTYPHLLTISLTLSPTLSSTFHLLFHISTHLCPELQPSLSSQKQTKPLQPWFWFWFWGVDEHFISFEDIEKNSRVIFPTS